MVGRQLPIFSVLIPGYLIIVLAGWRKMREILPAVLVTGISFAVVQFLVSNFVGPELTDIVAAAAGDATLIDRTWCLIVESPDGGWGLDGHAYTNAEIAQAARRELAGQPANPTG
jgi:glycolate permease/lactate permease